ncbi:MoaD/ThiS family protein [Pusillimonas sp. MFBS29]|uniref:MoaD/ThiS family protein n=1 Tax=Pusillimonas sp. MFBS29 TaxID=2886690 RepID=UPI001D1145FA|nr:MoaD/ThiS family protein [Pusillimonas sp. MFBS29]
MNGATIKVKYFARIAELTQLREELWPLSEPISGTDWLAALGQRYPQLEPMERLKLAINQYHSPHSSLIHPGDEIAVFEPVTGG